jgi:hypothetical protein
MAVDYCVADFNEWTIKTDIHAGEKIADCCPKTLLQSDG